MFFFVFSLYDKGVRSINLTEPMNKIKKNKKKLKKSIKQNKKNNHIIKVKKKKKPSTKLTKRNSMKKIFIAIGLTTGIIVSIKLFSKKSKLLSVDSKHYNPVLIETNKPLESGKNIKPISNQKKCSEIIWKQEEFNNLNIMNVDKLLDLLNMKLKELKCHYNKYFFINNDKITKKENIMIDTNTYSHLINMSNEFIGAIEKIESAMNQKYSSEQYESLKTIKLFIDVSIDRLQRQKNGEV